MKKLNIEKIEHRYHLGKPTGRRASFRILKQTGRKFETVAHPDLITINRNLKQKILTPDLAEKAVRELINKLYEADGARWTKVVHSSDNDRLLDKYWEHEYEGRDIVDKDTALYELRRAVAAVGGLSLQSSTKLELQKHIDSNYNGRKQRRIVTKLNQLLKWLGRDIRLYKKRPESEEIKYLKEDDFKKILTHIPGEALKCLHEVCYYGGFRIGESFALEENHFHEGRNNIKVLRQIDKTGVRRETKNRKVRNAFVFPQGVSALKRWFELRKEIDLKSRARISKVTRTACQKAFPHEPSKHINFHALRHCYAINLINKGVSISLVAQSIGDSIRVAEQHYVGFTLQEESLDMIAKLVRQNS
jgi:integrase